MIVYWDENDNQITVTPDMLHISQEDLLLLVGAISMYKNAVESDDGEFRAIAGKIIDSYLDKIPSPVIAAITSACW